MIRLLSVLFVLTLSGCITTDYVGKTYPATRHVDLFFDDADVERPYTVMGEMRVEADNSLFMRSEKMQRKLIKKARERGADGVIFAPVQIRVTGETVHTSGTAHADGKNRDSSSSTTTATADEKKELRGLLIKYEPVS